MPQCGHCCLYVNHWEEAMKAQPDHLFLLFVCLIWHLLCCHCVEVTFGLKVSWTWTSCKIGDIKLSAWHLIRYTGVGKLGLYPALNHYLLPLWLVKHWLENCVLRHGGI